MHAPPTTSPRSLPLSDRQFSERQEEVLDALEKVFFVEGLNVTVGDLAKAAHCSRRMLYELAPSKEELLLLVFDRMRRRLARAGRQAAEREDAPERQIEEFVRAGLAEFQPATPAFMEAIASYPPAQWLFEFHLSMTREFLVEKVEQGIADGDFREVHPELVVEALQAAVRRVLEPQVLEANRVGASDALAELFDLIVHGLVKSGPRRSGPRRARKRTLPGPHGGPAPRS